MAPRTIPRDLYPFEGRRLDLDGIGMHYLHEGEGEPVVMVHGNPTWSFYYRRLVLALRGSHRVIVPDHIGCGLSEKPGDDRYTYTLERRVEDLERLMDHLVPDGPVSLVVHDWGGMIGLGWALRRPERLARLVILNTAAFHKPDEAPLPWQLHLVRDTPFGALLVRGFNAFARGAARVATVRPLEPRVRDAYCAPYGSWSERIATLRFVQDIPLEVTDPAYALVSETEARLPLLRSIPVLICWGERDFVFDHHYLARWRELLPEAEVHTYPDAGHYVLEDAAEEIGAEVGRFLGAKGHA